MPTTLIIGAVVAVLVVLLATASYKVCPANKVMVITGPGGRRFVSGGSAFMIFWRGYPTSCGWGGIAFLFSIICYTYSSY